MRRCRTEAVEESAGVRSLVQRHVGLRDDPSAAGWEQPLCPVSAPVPRIVPCRLVLREGQVCNVFSFLWLLCEISLL